MSVAAISAIPRVAAPYPARIPMLDNSRPAWGAEQAAQSHAARQAQAQAAWEARRVARAQAAKTASSAQAAAPARDAATRTPIAVAAATPDVDGLRNLYADSRMRRAIEDYAAQPDPLAQRAGSANDLSTIEGLAPLQPYRVAMGNPQVQELQAAVAMKAAGIGIPKVANIGATENVTDNARYRPGRTP